MKKLILTTVVILVTFYLSNAQVNLFGVDLAKYADINQDLVYRKLNCKKNAFYTFAEYKSYPSKNLKFIMFDDFMAQHETPQMRNPKEYIDELSAEISKTLGESFKVYNNQSMTNPLENQYFWLVKQGDKYLVAKLFYSQFSQRNNLRVFIYDNVQDLVQGFKILTKVENKNENVYFDMAMALHKF